MVLGGTVIVHHVSLFFGLVAEAADTSLLSLPVSGVVLTFRIRARCGSAVA